jgi:hypothetical protein
MNSPTGFLPQFIVDNPRLLDWFAFASPGSVILKTGKVEIGQGILTALRQIAAEELDLPFSKTDPSMSSNRRIGSRDRIIETIMNDTPGVRRST